VRAANIFGFLGGAFPVLVGFFYGPSPKHDTSGWGLCGLQSAFPVVEPPQEDPPAYCLDCYECVSDASVVVFSIVVFSVLFVLSGLFAVRIAKSRSILFGLAPAVVTVMGLLVWLSRDVAFEIWPTLLVGATVLCGAAAMAGAGAYFSRRDA
jgi:hypothetical protein